MRLRALGLMLTLALGILVAPLSTEAQPASKLPRIGVIVTSGVPPSCSIRPFLDALQALGYVEGQTINIAWRCAEGRDDRARALAVALVQLGVDLIVTTSRGPTEAAKAATSTIPIVFTAGGDPVAAPALVASLAHPGGNVTGVSNLTDHAFFAKPLDLIREAVPGVTRMALLSSPPNPYRAIVDQPVEDAARAGGIELQRVEVEGPDDFEAAFAAMARQGVGALMVSFSVFTVHYAQIADLAVKYRLPAIAGGRAFAEQGGLMAYGASQAERWRRVASFVERILKGAKPADLPVERPTKFELVINLKTAKALGITVPPSLLARADEMIE